jgi:hypothetical protein
MTGFSNGRRPSAGIQGGLKAPKQKNVEDHRACVPNLRQLDLGRGQNQKPSRARATRRSGLRCPIHNRVYKGLSLTDRI